MKNKKGIKILSARNGIALISVLAILLILTLLLPVMFSMGEMQLKESITGTTRQKAYYLARSGVEMGVSYTKQIIYDVNDVIKAVGRNDDGFIDYEKTNADGASVLASAIPDEAVRSQKLFYAHFIETLRNKETATENTGKTDSDYGITRNSDGSASIDMQRLYFYLGKDDETKYLYKSADSLPDEITENEIDYKMVGYVDVTVKYSATPKYYDSNGVQVEERTCYEYNPNLMINEIKEGYSKIDNDVYIVKASSVVGSKKATTSAAIIQPKELGPSGDAVIQYTGATWAEAPDFYLEMNDMRRVGKRLSTGSKIYKKSALIEGNEVLQVQTESTDNGGNLCLSDITKANSKQQIQYENDYYAESVGGYVNQDVYVYTSIGDMKITCDGIGTEGNALVLGAYPGIRWKKANKPSTNVLKSVNYNDYSNIVQNANFLAYCATGTMQVDLGIDVRVNPARAGRLGDVKISLTKNSNNASLFKMIALQGKDIVIKGRTDMMFSFFDPQYKNYYTTDQERNTGKRMGTVLLMAPQNTPYSYYNEDRGTSVPAGMVYFGSDVYLWLIKYNNDGSSSGYTKLTETVYETKSISSNSFSKSTFTSHGKSITLEKASAGDFEVYRLFKAGDVYFFNSGVTQKKTNGEEENVGMSLVNWFIETQYLVKQDNTGISSFFKNFRKNIYVGFVQAAVDTDTYKYDDMHFIGNANKVPTLSVPSIDESLFVVWDS